MKWAERFKSKAEEGRVVRDLDAIISTSAYVKLHGKTHEIKPVLVDEFFALSNALATIKMLEQEDKVSLDSVINAYYGVVFSVCPTITRDDIRNSTHSQIAALMQYIVEHVTGDEKKKNPLMGLSQLAQ